MTGSTVTKDICKEYAIALFHLAVEESIEEKLTDDLALLRDVFEETPEYAAFLSAPSIPKEKRLRAVREAFGGALHEYAVSFVSLLCEKGQAEILTECVEEYEALYAASHRIAHAVVVSAVPLTESQQQRMTAALEKRSGCRVEAEYRLNPKLLGGVTVDMDGLRLDGSLRRGLKNIREVMDEWAEDPTK